MKNIRKRELIPQILSELEPDENGYKPDPIMVGNIIELLFCKIAHDVGWSRAGIGAFIEQDADGPSISQKLQESYIFKKADEHPEIVDVNSDFPVKTLCASYHKIQRITGTFVRGGKTELRLFTEKECKAIMGFPLDFKIPVSRMQIYRQFGNSVAVPIVAAIVKELVKSLRNVI